MKQLGHYETLNKMPKVYTDCILYLCGVSYENLGLILRSADIFDITTIYYYGDAGINQKQLSKISRNSKLQIHFVDDLNVLEDLKKEGYDIVALEITDTSVPLRTVHFQNKICLVVGNERNGVPESILDISDYACHIEMIGGNISSLNVAIATSIAMYEMTRCCLENEDGITTD